MEELESLEIYLLARKNAFIKQLEETKEEDKLKVINARLSEIENVLNRIRGQKTNPIIKD